MSTKIEVAQIYALSPMQEGMLYHHLLGDDPHAYHEQISFEIEGQFNIRILENSFKQLIHKYEALRTIFVYQKLNVPQQVVIRNRPVIIGFKDLGHLGKEAQAEYVKQFKQDDIAIGFDLSKDILIRMSVFQLGKELHQIVLSFHHIIMDGWSFGIVISDLFDMYSQEINSQKLPYRQAAPYSEYIQWLGRMNKEEAGAYWSEYLRGYEQQVFFPRCGPVNSAEKRFAIMKFAVDQALTSSMKQLAVTKQVTVSTIFKSLWGILLQKYNNTNDVVFGSIISGRSSELEGVEQMVGLFANCVPVRVKDEGTSFDELLREQQRQAWNAEKYGYTKLAEIQAASGLKQDLLNHLIAFENHPLDSDLEKMDGQGNLFGHRINNLDLYERTHYDLSVMVVPGDELQISITYNSTKYDSSTMNRVGDHFIQLVKEIIHNPSILVKQLDIMTEEEKRQIGMEFNSSANFNSEYATVQQMFESVATRYPMKIALRYNSANAQIGSFTYQALNEKANRLAHYLISQGIQQGDLVAIVMDSSPQAIVSMIGVLKAGCGYLPIDHQYYPEARFKSIIENSGATVVLTDSVILLKMPVLQACGAELMVWEDLGEALCEQPCHNPVFTKPQIELAYVIYTSGTTGTPKGVLLAHKGLINLAEAMVQPLRITPESRIVQFASYSFDASVFEIYIALLNGASLFLLDRGPSMLTDLADTLRDNEISIATLPPTVLKELETNQLPHLYTIVSAGESCTPEIIKKWSVNRNFVNAYGPTECTVCATLMDEISEIDTITIGKPIANTVIYIMNANQQLMPVGVIGEICIGGIGVARGYLRRSDLTEERFIQDPFLPQHNMYRTGDLGRWLPNGTIEFLGRIDHQVKIRGYRIETAEIEHQILQNECIEDVVVIGMDDSNGSKALYAFIIIQPNRTLAHEALKAFLNERLPHYMIPAYFIEMNEFPQTSNGKIDRNALKDTDKTIQADLVIEMPRNQQDELIYQVWSCIFKQSRFGINHTFSGLGGHSLQAIQVVSQLQKQGVQISIADLYQHESIKQLSDYIEQKEATNRIAEEANPVAVGQETLTMGDSMIEELVLKVMTLQSLLAPIKEAVTERVYEISTSQMYHLQHTDYTGTFLTFNQPVDIDRLEQAVNHVVKKHELLRGTITDADHLPKWEIHSYKPFNLPYIDISAYDASSQMKFVDQCINNLYFQPYEEQSSLFYRMLAVRRSSHEVVLFLPFSHVKLDLISSELLKKEIKDSYSLLSNDTKEIETKLSSYESFVNQTRSGPQAISDINLANEYQLSRIAEFSQLMNNKIGEFKNEASFMEFEFEICPEWNSQYLLGEIIRLSGSKFVAMLGLDEMPLGIVHHGRTYMDNSFYDCIGECLDIIPFLFRPDDAPDKMERRIHRLIDQKKTHNISFQELLYRAEAHPGFPQTSAYLKKTFEEYMLIFNYMGEASSEKSDYQTAIMRHMQFAPYKRILIEACHIENKIIVKYVLPFKAEH